MTPQHPLSQLNAIQLPAEVSAWPPAPGWWILAALVLTALLLGGYLFWKARRRSAYRRAALQTLNALRETRDHHTPSSYLQAINGLLTQTAITAYPQHSVAALHSDAWLTFLSEQSDLPFSDKAAALGQISYQAAPEEVDLAEIERLAGEWIRRHRHA